ncbi:MAG: MFS transporter [SAR202 cluster bacterium]|jgi:sugar phosphate permease|nr:MFS transporter [Chloroflexota bacterium]MQG25017.1 MFS transporter [SAR202 cluster bacterium]MQG84567.1 MFS transporter [SAR202 cluster bacterium]|tara:strand:+ start:2692 stop:3933 length:1242 start_codon:yes stop_codon:yes gene_type:complete
MKQYIANKSPIYYGWIILLISTSMSAVRPVMAVATLSVFITPMSDELNWSRTAFSGAVSIGGFVGAFASPIIGKGIDRYGTSLVMAFSSLIVAVSAIAISQIESIVYFYVFYICGRAMFAGPLMLAPAVAVSNWFVTKRAITLAILQVSQGLGLAIIPFIAKSIIVSQDWPSAWIFLGIMVLIIGVIPPGALMVRKPEDVGLMPDNITSSSKSDDSAETSYTLKEALRTHTMWFLMIFAGFGFMVQAGISLHQAPYYHDQGIPYSQAASIVSIFALSSATGGFLFPLFTTRFSARIMATLSSLFMTIGVIIMIQADTFYLGVISALVFGNGLGGMSTLINVLWADYYGRESLGVIRGVSLPVQTGGQAIGPIASGVLYDLTGDYFISLIYFLVVISLATVFVFVSKPPKKQNL